MLFEERLEVIPRILRPENEITVFHCKVKKILLHHAIILPGFYAVIPELLMCLISGISSRPICNLQTPNIFTILPNENGNILMEDIRKAIEFANKSTINEKEKFIIIHSFENISLNSANALLKVLEEPPGDTFFLLIAKETANLLPTIKSRCLNINFSNSMENFLFLCTFKAFWKENSNKLAELTSYNLSLLTLFDEESFEFITNLETLITRNFNYLAFKTFYKKYQNLSAQLFFLGLENIIHSNIKTAFGATNMVDMYFRFISTKKYVKLYNTNMELFLYCTIFNLCKNIFY